MSVAIAVYILFAIAATFLTALIWRPVTAALVLAALIAAGYAAPFVFFGVWGLWEGQALGPTLRAVTIVLPSISHLAWYATFWAMPALLAGWALRTGWMMFKRRSL